MPQLRKIPLDSELASSSLDLDLDPAGVGRWVCRPLFPMLRYVAGSQWEGKGVGVLFLLLKSASSTTAEWAVGVNIGDVGRSRIDSLHYLCCINLVHGTGPKRACLLTG